MHQMPKHWTIESTILNSAGLDKWWECQALSFSKLAYQARADGWRPSDRPKIICEENEWVSLCSTRGMTWPVLTLPNDGIFANLDMKTCSTNVYVKFVDEQQHPHVANISSAGLRSVNFISTFGTLRYHLEKFEEYLSTLATWEYYKKFLKSGWIIALFIVNHKYFR